MCNRENKDLVDISMKDIMINSVSEINPFKEDRLFCFILCISLVAYVHLFIDNNNSIGKFLNINGLLFEISLSLFALSTTVYTFLMSFSIKQTLLELDKREYTSGDKSYLQKFFKSFESVLFLLFIVSFYTFLLKLLDKEILKISINILGKEVSAIILYLYLFISIRIVYETKNLLYNAYIFIRFNIKQVFNYE